MPVVISNGGAGEQADRQVTILKVHGLTVNSGRCTVLMPDVTAAYGTRCIPTSTTVMLQPTDICRDTQIQTYAHALPLTPPTPPIPKKAFAGASIGRMPTGSARLSRLPFLLAQMLVLWPISMRRERGLRSSGRELQT